MVCESQDPIFGLNVPPVPHFALSGLVGLR